MTLFVTPPLVREFRVSVLLVPLVGPTDMLAAAVRFVTALIVVVVELLTVLRASASVPLLMLLAFSAVSAEPLTAPNVPPDILLPLSVPVTVTLLSCTVTPAPNIPLVGCPSAPLTVTIPPALPAFVASAVATPAPGVSVVIALSVPLSPAGTVIDAVPLAIEKVLVPTLKVIAPVPEIAGTANPTAPDVPPNIVTDPATNSP
jgi:hypothetical protein